MLHTDRVFLYFLKCKQQVVIVTNMLGRLSILINSFYLNIPPQHTVLLMMFLNFGESKTDCMKIKTRLK